MENAVLERECIRCGYNLRGLAEDGQCPECGEAVKASEKGRGWGAADAGWRRRVRLGALLHAMGLGMFWLVFLNEVFGLVGLRTPTEYWVMMVAVVLGAAGVWMAASGEPGGPYYDDRPWSRRVLRGIAALAVVGMGGYLAVQILEQKLGRSFSGIGLWQTIAGIPAFGGSIVGSAVLTWHLARMARRMKRGRLVWWGRVSAFSTPATVGLVFLCAMLFRVYSPSQFVLMTDMVHAVQCPAALAGDVCASVAVLGREGLRSEVRGNGRGVTRAGDAWGEAPQARVGRGARPTRGLFALGLSGNLFGQLFCRRIHVC